jgi:hypothetical protein
MKRPPSDDDVAIVGEGKPIRIGNVYSQGELVVAGTEAPVAGPSGMQNKKQCRPPDACPPLEELVKKTLVKLKTTLFEQLKLSVKQHTDHRGITDDDLREAIDEVGETLSLESSIPEHLGVVDSIVKQVKANKMKVLIEHPDILPHFERFMNNDYDFGRRSFQIIPPQHHIVAVIPRYDVDLGEQLIMDTDYLTFQEGDALNVEIRRLLNVMQEYNRLMNLAREEANIRIRSIQMNRAGKVRLAMLNQAYEDNYSREIAAILESFAANIEIWHGIQNRNLMHILRIRRRQSMIFWFRQNYYPDIHRPPPRFKGERMVLHLTLNPLSEPERRFIANPTMTTLPTLAEGERNVQPHDITNNVIIVRMMGPDTNGNQVHPNNLFSTARGGAEDDEFRLVRNPNLPTYSTSTTTQRPTRAPRPTRFPRIELKRDV